MSERAKGSQIEVEGKTLPEKLSDLQADINTRANADAVAQALALKADADAVSQALALKADNSVMSLALADKADKTQLNGLATETFVSQAVSGLATDTSVAGKADKTYVDTELGKKADADAVGLALAQKADATALAAKADASALAQLRSDAVLESELTSETGNSTTKVMSQRGVTDAIRAAGGGASALADLTDVDFGTPADGQVLTYDAATQKSKFTDPAGGGGGDVEEAPLDGKLYARKDAAWEEVAAGGGDVEEAPLDGRAYARRDAEWTEALVFLSPLVEGTVLKGDRDGRLVGSDVFTASSQRDPQYSDNQFYVYKGTAKNTVAAGFPFEFASGLFMAGTEAGPDYRTHQVFFTTSGIFVRNATGKANSVGTTWGSWIKYIEDAPNDGNAYVRKNGNWVDVTTL